MGQVVLVLFPGLFMDGGGEWLVNLSHPYGLRPKVSVAVVAGEGHDALGMF